MFIVSKQVPRLNYLCTFTFNCRQNHVKICWHVTNCIAVDNFQIMKIDLWEFLQNILLLFIKRIAYYFLKMYELYEMYCTSELQLYFNHFSRKFRSRAAPPQRKINFKSQVPYCM